MTMQCVQVKLELGHKAAIRAKPTAEGFTHDWTVFVRGPEGSNIQHFVEKVVFHLHESFPKPKRVVKEPPYQVTESGYACFCLPVEVHFKNREEPKKVCFEYDLVLHLEGPPINHIRCEKLTFQNPTEDFRRKLIKAGGVGILDPEGGTILGQNTETLSDVLPSLPQPPKAKSSPDIAVKKHKTKESTPKLSSSSHISPAQEPFVELFGQPIKTSKSSPDPKKLKETGKLPKNVSTGEPSLSTVTSSMTVSSSTVTIRDGKNSFSKGKERRPYGSGSSGKVKPKKPPSPPEPPPTEPKPAEKTVAKRPQTPPGSPSDIKKEVKKRKRNSSSQSSSSKTPREKHSDKRKSIKEEGEKTTVPKPSVTSEKSHASKKATTTSITTDVDIKHKGAEETRITKENHRKSSTKEKTKSREENVSTEKGKGDSKISPNVSSPDDSPESSISFSSLQISGKRGPLGALMAELDDQDDDDELLSPLSSSDPPSPPRFMQHDDSPPKPPEPPPVTKPPKKKSEKQAKKSEIKQSQLLAREAMTEQMPPKETVDKELSQLVALQHRIMSMQDPDSLQKIVDILEETGLYTITSETLDFDLCMLDKDTLQKIQNCLVPAY